MYGGVSTHDDFIGIMKVLSTTTRRLDIKAQEGAIGLFAPFLPGRPVPEPELLCLLNWADSADGAIFRVIVRRRSRFGAVERVQQSSTGVSRAPCGPLNSSKELRLRTEHGSPP
jgi:hypothetical protein